MLWLLQHFQIVMRIIFSPHSLPYLAWVMKFPQHHLDAQKKILQKKHHEKIQKFLEDIFFVFY